MWPVLRSPKGIAPLKRMAGKVEPIEGEPMNAQDEILRLRLAMARAAQRAESWPDSNDDPADVLSDCADILYDALQVPHNWGHEEKPKLSQAEYEARAKPRLARIDRLWERIEKEGLTESHDVYQTYLYLMREQAQDEVDAGL